MEKLTTNINIFMPKALPALIFLIAIFNFFVCVNSLNNLSIVAGIPFTPSHGLEAIYKAMVALPNEAKELLVYNATVNSTENHLYLLLAPPFYLVSNTLNTFEHVGFFVDFYNSNYFYLFLYLLMYSVIFLLTGAISNLVFATLLKSSKMVNNFFMKVPILNLYCKSAMANDASAEAYHRGEKNLKYSFLLGFFAPTFFMFFAFLLVFLSIFGALTLMKNGALVIPSAVLVNVAIILIINNLSSFREKISNIFRKVPQELQLTTLLLIGNFITHILIIIT